MAGYGAGISPRGPPVVAGKGVAPLFRALYDCFMITHFDLVKIGIPLQRAHALMDTIRWHRKYERLENLDHLKSALQRRAISAAELARTPGVGDETINRLYESLGLETPKQESQRVAAARKAAEREERKKQELTRLGTREGALERRDKMIAQAHRAYERRIAKIEAAEQNQ